MESKNTGFSLADFIVFFVSLLLALMIGLYYGWKDRKKKSIKTYYFGDGEVTPFAVGMSMAVSYISGTTLIGAPVEVYFYGPTLIWTLLANPLSTSLAVVYYIPLIFRLRLVSVYEYMELRYNRAIRLICSISFVIFWIMYMGINVYVPALALESVTPLNLTWSIALTSLVCTIYTTLGGMKAVIWTDVLQTFVMAIGLICLFAMATADLGGLSNVAESANRGGRSDFTKFYADPRQRTNGLSYIIGSFVISATGMCFSQVEAQRFLSCKSIRAARTAAMLHFIPAATFLSFAVATGIVMYATYEGCDPFKSGHVTKRDELTSRFAVETFQGFPGLAGLFVSAVYSGALSTVSSGINSLAAVATEDYINPRLPNLSMPKKDVAAKVITVIIGCIVTGFAYMMSFVEANMTQAILSITGLMQGPIFAAFFMGTLCPWINNAGAIVGMVAGWAISVWCAVGQAIYYPAREFVQPLPTSVEDCYANFTMPGNNSGMYGNATYLPGVQETISYRSVMADTFYSISPYLYGPLGVLVAFVTMLLISGITGANKPSEMKPELFVPLIDNEKIFPKSVVRFFRFGVPEMTKDKQREEGYGEHMENLYETT